MNELSHERRYRIAVLIVVASEALLFAGLFTLYATYRTMYHHAFDAGVRADIQWIGGTNTLVLLTSSFFMAWSIHLVRSGKQRSAAWCLGIVLLLGCAFLTLKGIEWGSHIEEGVVLGPSYHGDNFGPGTRLFFTLYYLMTGLHAAHVVAGMMLVLWMFVRVRQRRIVAERHLTLELVGLYWHFVDLVWVFLWPMFYLMDH